MATQPESVRIVRCKTTRHGLLILFSDGQVHLFHESFLVQNRMQHGDRIIDAKALTALIADAKPNHGAERSADQIPDVGTC
jgi:hypothetical protein